MSNHDQSTTPRTPSKDDLAHLTHLSALLHLLHHRNKNQHRRSPWYRHLSLFRRHLAALLEDYATLTASPPEGTTNVERARLKARLPGVRARVAQRLAFWQDVLVARWMRAFSQVVADGRFSVLGLVMVGALGGVCRVVGVTEGLEAVGQGEVERVLEEFGREAWGGEDRARDEDVVVARGGDDEGEIVARGEEEGDGADDGDVGRGDGADGPTTTAASLSDNEAKDIDQGASTLVEHKPSPVLPKTEKAKPIREKKRPTEETKSKPAKKKRKKGGDAIDDLFSGW